MNADLCGVTLDLDARNTRLEQGLLEEFTDVVILDQGIAESVVLSKPAGIPIFDDTHAQAVWIYFLAHDLPPLPAYSFSFRTMVMCEVLLRTLNALPCALGLILLRMGPGQTKHSAT